MKRKKSVLKVMDGKRKLPLANITHTTLACFFSRLRHCGEGTVQERVQSQGRTAEQPLGVVPLPLQKQLRALPHTISHALDDAASKGNVPITALGAEVPTQP